jgi:hypothetical protein
MSSFITKRKVKTVINFKVDDLEEKDSTFTLKNINPAQLDKKYNMKDLKKIIDKELVDIDTSKEIKFNEPKKNNKKSDIAKLTSELESLGISDNKPKTYETIVTSSTNIKIKAYTCFKEEHEKCEVPKFTNIKCWWCRSCIPKTIHPLGMPIRYNKEGDFFDTEGIFCSFNCMCSYLHENTNVSQYKDSGSLIYFMYKLIFNEYPYKMNIRKAPSWKLLKEYGGHLSIEDFRSMFNTVNIHTQNIEYGKELPKGDLPLRPVKLMYLDS